MKTILITGANTGIGKACALELAAKGTKIVLACRSRERTLPVLDAIRQRGAEAEFVELDLGSIAAAAAAGRAYAGANPGLDVLVLNAGVGGAKGVTKDGFEMAFGVNHLGHFAFAKPLLAGLDEARGRLVVVASKRHFEAKSLPFSSLREGSRTLTARPEYAVSKLCNILFTAEVRRRYPHVDAISMNPGRIATDIYRRVPRVLRPLIPILFRLETAASAGTTLARIVRLPEKGSALPLYLQKLTPTEPSRLATDPELASRLWETSEQWIAPFLAKPHFSPSAP